MNDHKKKVGVLKIFPFWVFLRMLPYFNQKIEQSKKNRKKKQKDFLFSFFSFFSVLVLSCFCNINLRGKASRVCDACSSGSRGAADDANRRSHAAHGARACGRLQPGQVR